MRKEYRLIELDAEQKEKAIEFAASFFDCCRYETWMENLNKSTKLKDFDCASRIMDNTTLTIYDSLNLHVITRLRLEFFEDTFPKFFIQEDNIQNEKELIEGFNETIENFGHIKYFIDFDEILETLSEYTIEQLMLFGDILNTQASIRFNKILEEEMNLIKRS